MPKLYKKRPIGESNGSVSLNSEPLLSASTPPGEFIMCFRIVTVVIMLCLPVLCCAAEGVIQLPAPRLDVPMSAGKVIATEKALPSSDEKALTLVHVARLVWAANGNIPLDPVSGAPQQLVTCAAKAYPLEIFLVTGEGSVEQVPAGVYRYDPVTHALAPGLVGDQRQTLAQATNSHDWIPTAPISVIIGAIFERSQSISGLKGAMNFATMEAKNCNQNVLLEARALKLNSNTVTQLNDSQVSSALRLPPDVRPIVIVTVRK
jgi:SagB-type dehydrogenase family enzyme